MLERLGLTYCSDSSVGFFAHVPQEAAGDVSSTRGHLPLLGDT